MLFSGAEADDVNLKIFCLGQESQKCHGDHRHGRKDSCTLHHAMHPIVLCFVLDREDQGRKHRDEHKINQNPPRNIIYYTPLPFPFPFPFPFLFIFLLPTCTYSTHN